jgi:hypothetical protein
MAICLDSNHRQNTGILHAGQMTDHANNADTDFWVFCNLLNLKYFYCYFWLARPMQYSLQVFIHQAKELKND